MQQSSTVNRRIVLASRPVGAVGLDDFRLEEIAVPTPQVGEVLLRTLWLSLDPYMRGRISDAPSYAPPIELGEVMVGGTVSIVDVSRHPGFSSGDLVLGQCGWQDYAISDGSGLTLLDPAMPHPSLALGVLGMPGFTAYMGLTDIGRPQPGETVVVAAARGAVGSAVGQIAKILGCRVVGIAGGAAKCSSVVNELGFDACLDRHDADLPQQLAAACPDGIDVYFENVGGEVFDAVLPLLNVKARVPVCGLIAQYDGAALPIGPDRTGLLMRTVLSRRIRLQGFIVYADYGTRYAEFAAAMGPWVAEGRVRQREDIVEGLEHAPQAFLGLLAGRNVGKLVVQVAHG